MLGACTKDPASIEEINNDQSSSLVEKNDERDQKKEKDKEEEEHLNSTSDEKKETHQKPKYTITENWFIKPIDDADERVVLLTIDDAPENYALEMARILKKLEAPAIFFVNGHFLETKEQRVALKEIFDLGFTIGNHTYSHRDLTTLSEDEQREEILKVNDMIEEITGEKPIFFRPPFGNFTDYSKELLEEEQMIYMNWTYGYDWEAEYQTKEAIVDIMVNTELLLPGSNLLMHDRKWTFEGLEDIVKGLRKQGYSFVDPKLIKSN